MKFSPLEFILSPYFIVSFPISIKISKILSSNNSEGNCWINIIKEEKNLESIASFKFLL